MRVGKRVLVAGTAPIPSPGRPPADSAYEQMLRCGQIALDALAELGMGAAQVVRTRMYIVDPADADAVGRAHRRLFGEADPAATMVVVAGLLDPTWRVELELEAMAEDSGVDPVG